MSIFKPATKVVAIEKRSSLAYLKAVLETQRGDALAMPMDIGAAGSVDGVIVDAVFESAEGGGWFSDRIVPRSDPGPAQISLSSGTTGRPKPILISHRALADVTERLIQAQGLDDSIREYVGVPVTYSFGFGRIRAVAAVGGASYLPERGFRTDELADMLSRGEVNALSAVPTLLRLVLDRPGRLSDAGKALRWLEIGSQALSAPEKAAIRNLFPNARIVQHYGLTEASRSTFLDISSADDAALASVGRANGEVEIKITLEGLIAVRGPHLADGILTAAGLMPITGDDGWLVTNDLGSLRDGLLHFEGRADDLVNVGGIKVPSDLFEEKLVQRLGPGWSIAAAPGSDALRGQVVVVAHEPLPDPAADAALRDAVAAVATEMGIADGAVLLPVPTIPRTATSKVRRNALTQAFADRDRAPVAAPAPVPANPSEVSAVFISIFGEAARDETASFESLGGDSLHYVMMLTGLEACLPVVPQDWDRMSIAALGVAPLAGAEGVAEAFASVFGEPGRNPDATFQSLGGDSLHYVMVLTALEELLPAVPEDWDRMTVAQLGAPPNPDEQLIGDFVAVFGDSARNEGASFQSLGGHSTEATALEPRLKERLGLVPADWRSLSVGALSSLAADRAFPDQAKSAKRRLPRNLDTARSLACLLVVALHVVGVDPGEGLDLPGGSVWHRVMDAIDLVRMPLFTALAGFLYGAMPAKRDGFAPYMKRKLGQLAYPLLFATLVYWTLRQVTYGTNEKSLLWAYVDGYVHLWYLDALLLIFAFVSLVDTRVNTGPRTWAAIIAGVAATYWAVPDIPVLHLQNTLSLLPFFIFGLLLYRAPVLLESRAVLAGSIAAVVGTIVLQQGFPVQFAVMAQFGLLGWLCGMAAVVATLRLLPKLSFIEGIAAFSFTIYLWHPAASATMRNLLWRVGLHDIWALFLIGLAVGVLVPIAMHLVVQRLPKFASTLIIGR